MKTITQLPNYIIEMIENGQMTIANNYDNNLYVGYTYKVDSRFKTVTDYKFESNVNRLIKFATKHGAMSEVIQLNVRVIRGQRISSALVGITDPVSNLIDKVILKLKTK